MPKLFATRYQRNYYIRRYAYGPALQGLAALLFVLSPFIPRAFYALKAPVFIVGCSRSGTTVFIEWFRRHRDLCDWSEGAQVFEPRIYACDVDHFMDETSATPFRSARIRMLFGLKTRVLARPRFVNKHPENSFRIRFIKALFPDAMFIHMIRDGFAAIQSNMERAGVDPFRRAQPLGYFPKPRDWREHLSQSPAQQYAHLWVEAVSYIRKCAADGTIAPGRYKEIRYEDFCADPRGVLADAYRFCGLDPQRWGPAPEEAVAAANNRWRAKLTQREIEEIEAIAGSLNRELGYAAQTKTPARQSS